MIGPSMTKPPYRPQAYISGPMRGHEFFNYPAFHTAAEYLRNAGYGVLNPASNFDGDDTLPRNQYMVLDFMHVLQADVVFMLEGYQTSEGALSEKLVAEQCDIKVYVLQYDDQGEPVGFYPSNTRVTTSAN